MLRKTHFKRPWELTLLSLLGLLTLIFPYVSYTYKKRVFSLAGYHFLTGTEILGKSVTITTNPLVIGIILFLGIAFLCSLLWGKRGQKLISYLIIISGVVVFALAFLLQNSFAKVFEKAKAVHSGYGLIILMLLCVLLIVRTGMIMYHEKIISPLDFMALPCLCYLVINNYFPMVGIFIAFKKIDYAKGIWGSDWVGLDNFKFLFQTNDAFIMTRNTILYNVAFIVLGNIIGIIVGIMLYEIWSKRAKKFYQTAILLPQLISMIIVSYIVYAFLSSEAGFINNTFMGENPVNFYAEVKYWPFILIFVNIWKGLGYSSIIYLSAMLSIDKSMYEAARVDGAGKMQQICHITLPMLRPTVVTLIIMQVGRIFFSDFGLFLQVPMNSGALYSVTQTIDTYVYRSLMQLNQVGMASAAGLFQSVVGFLVVLAANAIVRKLDRDNAMF